MVCNLKTWAPGIQGVSSFVAATANIIGQAKKVVEVIMNAEPKLKASETYQAFQSLHQYILVRAGTCRNSKLTKEGSPLLCKDKRWERRTEGESSNREGRLRHLP